MRNVGIAPFLNAEKMAVSATYRAVCDTDSVRIVCPLGDLGGQRSQRLRDHTRTRLGCSPEHGKGDHHGHTETPHQGSRQHHPRQGRRMEVPQGPRGRPRHRQTPLRRSQGTHQGRGQGTVRRQNRRARTHRPHARRQIPVPQRLRGTLAGGLPASRQAHHLSDAGWPPACLLSGHRPRAPRGSDSGACPPVHARAGGAAPPR